MKQDLTSKIKQKENEIQELKKKINLYIQAEQQFRKT